MRMPDRLHADPAIAIVHDAFTQRGGAERLVHHLARLFPQATIHAAVADPDVTSADPGAHSVRVTGLQRLHALGVPLRAMAPLLPVAFRTLNVGRADIVISSTSAFAHHVRPPAGAVHIAYCHTPPRFLWQPEVYFRPGSPADRAAAPALALLRHLDVAAARRVDVLIANSAHTAAEIARVYGRPARVVHPPIDTAVFTPTGEHSGRFLVVARLKPHKRIDLAIDAANRLRVPLDIVGEGPEVGRLRRLAGPTVRFLGRRPDADVAAAMARCAGLIVPGVEDFGMTTAEVQAAGRPPIAYAAGGALEIVRDGETGFLFERQAADAIAEAMVRALREPLDTAALVASARRFDASVFDVAMRDLVAALAEARTSGRPMPDPARGPALDRRRAPSPTTALPSRSAGVPRC